MCGGGQWARGHDRTGHGGGTEYTLHFLLFLIGISVCLQMLIVTCLALITKEQGTNILVQNQSQLVAMLWLPQPKSPLDVQIV